MTDQQLAVIFPYIPILILFGIFYAAGFISGPDEDEDDDDDLGPGMMIPVRAGAWGRLKSKTIYAISKGDPTFTFFMSEPKFYVYSKNGCTFCEKLTIFMESKGINYEKFDLDSDFTTEDFLIKFGNGSTFPQVSYNNIKIGGMKDTVRYLQRNKMVWLN